MLRRLMAWWRAAPRVAIACSECPYTGNYEMMAICPCAKELAKRP